MFDKVTQPFKVVFLFCAALTEDKVDDKVQRISLFQLEKRKADIPLK